MLEPGLATFDGEYASVRGAINVPKGIQQPRIPIIVGGNGARVTAGYADPLRRRAELRVPARRRDRAAHRGRSALAARRKVAIRPHLRFSLYTRDEELRERGQARVDVLAGLAAIGLDRLVCFPTRWSPTLEAQAAFAEDCRAAGLTLGELNRGPVRRASQPARGIRPRRRSGAYRNQARPTSSSSGTGPYWRESIGSPKPAAAVTSGAASLTSQASSSASSR